MLLKVDVGVVVVVLMLAVGVGCVVVVELGKEEALLLLSCGAQGHEQGSHIEGSSSVAATTYSCNTTRTNRQTKKKRGPNGHIHKL